MTRILSGKSAEHQVQRMAGRASSFAAAEPAVKRIVNAVRRGGDRALRRFAERWDGLEPGAPLRVPEAEISAAWKSAAPEFRKALRRAAANIRRFCQWQKPKEWLRQRDGICLGQLVRPLESVGCYVPGGRYPLPSSLLMTVIPAQVAGVRQIRVVSPRPRPETLAAAALLGVREFYRIGGAQAIAALAYGTESIAAVDKIVGPGNLYVTTAKKLVAFDCAIDFLAGPTEVVIFSDDGDPDFIAADLVAQAEHDPEALAVFITTSRELATRTARAITAHARDNAVARQSLRRRGMILIAGTRAQALEWVNQIAPEHLTISRRDLPLVRNAGSVFVGEYSPQAAGDYASGPNHVLPTGGVARFRGGLSVMDFVKVITVQELSQQGLDRIAPAVVSLAGAEGLKAHAQSVRVRCAHA
jgi:histidinol dehydrogenase